MKTASATIAITAIALWEGTSTDHDAVINEENKTIDRKVKGICRGC